MSKVRPLQRAAGGLGPRPAPPVSARYQPYEQDAKVKEERAKVIVTRKTERPVVVMQSTWDMPFKVEARRCSEHHARNLHRPLHPAFLSSRALWLRNSLDSAASRPYFTPRKAGTPLGKPPACEGDVNLRALLVTGISPDEALHVLRRVTCVFSKFEQHIGAYGGLCDSKSTDQQQKALTEMVAAQCGVTVQSWSPLVELTYSDGSKTIFFTPNGLSGDVQFAEAQGMCPTVASFVDLLDCKIECTSHNKDLWELLTAVDAYDEYMRRDMAERLHTLLLENKQKMQESEQAAADHEEAVRKEHARREQDVVDRLEACKQRELSMKASWVMEDEGKTDRQKRDSAEQRAAEMVKLEAETEAIRICEEKIEEEVHTATLCENKEAYVSFQYFDRPKGVACGLGTISRTRLASLLLSLSHPELNSQRKANELLDAALPLGARIPYPTVCIDITRH